MKLRRLGMVQLTPNLAAAECTLEPLDLERLGNASALAAGYPGWYLEQFDEV